MTEAIFEKQKLVKTRGIVLRRTNYGESDRILEVLTPEGKVGVMAKGVRKERSKLAGGIELFSVTEVCLRSGRSLATLTSAKMLRFYGGVMGDLARMELVGEVMRMVARAAEAVDSPELFDLLEQVLDGLDRGEKVMVVEVWLRLNLARVMGEPVNVNFDTRGEPLVRERKYRWIEEERALEMDERGEIGENEIKLLRLMQVAKLMVIGRVAEISKIVEKILPIAKSA